MGRDAGMNRQVRRLTGEEVAPPPKQDTPTLVRDGCYAFSPKVRTALRRWG